MKEKRNPIFDAALGGLAVYGLYKIATHPKVKAGVREVYSKVSKKNDNTVDYVSEEDADINASCKPAHNDTYDAFVDVTPNDEV